MSLFIVDASVAVKWFLPEAHSQEAQRLLNGIHILFVPDLVFSEVGNILWKRVRVGDITSEEAHNILQTFGTLPLQVSPSWPLTLAALEIACRLQRTVYDSLYLALAVREQGVMVTADEKFYNALQNSPLVPYLCWIGDIP